MIWRIALGVAGFWLSFYALSFTPPRIAWWTVPYVLTFGGMAVGSLALFVSAFWASVDDDKRALAWLLSRALGG